MQTRETFIQSVRAAVLATAPDLTDAERTMLSGLKMVYGSGSGMRGTRGVTYFRAWTTPTCGPECDHDGHGALIELCAFAEESVTQLCGTTIHELAHALAGSGAGHGSDWKAACVRLGLRTAKAAGTTYRPAMFAPRLRDLLVRIPLPTDGKALTAWGQVAPPAATGPRPCSHGTGSRGGRSRGPGSGSRLRKWVCACGVIARVASDAFEADCRKCGSAFQRADTDRAARS